MITLFLTILLFVGNVIKASDQKPFFNTEDSDRLTPHPVAGATDDEPGVSGLVGPAHSPAARSPQSPARSDRSAIPLALSRALHVCGTRIVPAEWLQEQEMDPKERLFLILRACLRGTCNVHIESYRLPDCLSTSIVEMNDKKQEFNYHGLFMSRFPKERLTDTASSFNDSQLAHEISALMLEEQQQLCFARAEFQKCVSIMHALDAGSIISNDGVLEIKREYEE